jgi:hypothetical protein
MSKLYGSVSLSAFPISKRPRLSSRASAARGYISTDSTERYLTEWEFVCLKESEQLLTPTLSRPTLQVSKAAGVSGEDFHIFPSRKEEVQEEAM